MKSKKILFLCGYSSMYGGNFIPSLLELEGALNKKSVVCYYLFPKEAANRYWYNYLVESGKNVYSADFSVKRKDFLKSLKEFVDEQKINIIYSHFFSQTTVMLFQRMQKNIQTFIHIHSDWTGGNYNLKSKLKNFIIYRLLSGKTRFISVSKDFVIFNPQKITYVPNGLALNRIISKQKNIESLRSNYNIDDNDYLIEIFGWAPKVKGVDIAVSSVKKLYDAGYSNIKLAIITGGDSDKTKEYIKKTTPCNGEEKFLRYLPPVEDVFIYHKASDLMLSTSRSEGFSYSILEALSLGKNVVSSSIPGTQWANEYETVLMFNSEDVSGCAEAIKESMNMKKPRTDVSSEVKYTYSIGNWVNGVIKALRIDD